MNAKAAKAAKVSAALEEGAKGGASLDMHKVMIFVTGGAILALEVIASRVLSPYFGVSVYIWSGILAVTLAFLAIGYAVGGWLTTRATREHIDAMFHLFPVLGAFSVLAASRIYPHIFYDLADWSLLWGCYTGCAILLAAPLVMLAALNPLLVPLVDVPAKADVTDSGAGHVYFISTVGSVAGVLFAAFAVIPHVTNNQAMLVIAGLLGAVAVVGSLANRGVSKTHRKWAAIGGGMAMLGAAAFWF